MGNSSTPHDAVNEAVNSACFLGPIIGLAAVWNLMGADDPFPLVVGSGWLLLTVVSALGWKFSRSRLVKSAAKAMFLSCLCICVGMVLFAGFCVWAFGGLGENLSICWGGI